MDLFLVDQLQSGLNLLGQEESFHCIRTTRHRVGDAVWLTDGQGNLGRGIVIKADAQAAQVQVEEVQQVPPSATSVTLAVAPLKNDGRFEWLIEKAVELGVDRIIPLLTKRTEKVYLKQDRLERIITAAMKQSIKAWRPTLSNPLTPEQIDKTDFQHMLLAHCQEGEKINLTQLSPTGKILLLIGPEGDFTPEEVAFFEQAGAQSISLGTHRLRTETAAISALAVLTMRA